VDVGLQVTRFPAPLPNFRSLVFFHALAQLEGENGQLLTALFNNDIGPSLFLKADVRRRNCTWATCGGGSARMGAACAGASATVCVQDNDGIYRSGWLYVLKHHFMFQMSHATRHTSHVIRHTSLAVQHAFKLRALFFVSRGSAASHRVRTGQQQPGQSPPARHTSHVTRHTSHVTRHTSHVTRHTSHVTRHTSHVTRHTPHATRHTSHVTRHTSHVTLHTSHATRHTPHVTRHTPHVTRHTSHATRHTSHATRHTSHAILQLISDLTVGCAVVRVTGGGKVTAGAADAEVNQRVESWVRNRQSRVMCEV
jgi:hypothetical protein